MSQMKIIGLSAMMLASMLAVQPVYAEKGDWIVRFGAAQVDPSENSRGVVPDNAIGVDDDTQLYVNATYMVNDNVGVEVLAATPFGHDISLDGTGKIAEADQLPPTISVNFHANPDARVRPYAGIGVNYTKFFSEDAVAVIDSINLDSSWGLAIQAGVDVDINDEWFFNANIRKIDIETTARTNLGNIDVTIDPVVISIGIGKRF